MNDEARPFSAEFNTLVNMKEERENTKEESESTELLGKFSYLRACLFKIST